LPNHKITRLLLGMGIAVPFLYFGIQLLAAPFYPGYSFVRNVASELGSDLGRYPHPFNLALMLLGLVTIAAAFGFWRALRYLHANPALTFALPLAITVIGFQTLWAGYFPMPDPRHGGHPIFIVNMILLPLLLTTALWKQQGSGSILRGYLVATLLLLLGMVPVMSGRTGKEHPEYRGLCQRLFTLTLYPPIGVGASILRRRLNKKETAC
jgi:hypothetical protein